MRISLTETDFIRKPWKNLRGSTLELFKYPDEDFLFRLSCADLTESGPFSSFPGIDRILVVTEGPAITLNESPLPLWKPVSFRGEEAMHADITGPGKDFNLMLKRSQVTGSVEVGTEKKILKADADYFGVLTFQPLRLEFSETEIAVEAGKYLVIRINNK